MENVFSFFIHSIKKKRTNDRNMEEKKKIAKALK